MSKSRYKKTAIRLKRRSSRVPRVDTPALDHVLLVVNDLVYKPERFDQARKEIRETFDRIVRYCDNIEDALDGIGHWPDREVELKKHSDRVGRALELARNMPDLFAPVTQRSFDVRVKLSHDPESQKELLDRQPVKHRVVSSNTEGTEIHFKEIRQPTETTPYIDDLFRVGDPFFYPTGDVQVQVYWELFQGIRQLNDLRKLRRCSNLYYHTEPFYFLRKKVERQERSFCSDDCRKHYHNNKEKGE